MNKHEGAWCNRIDFYITKVVRGSRGYTTPLYLQHPKMWT
jgi:hypothetical protein